MDTDVETLIRLALEQLREGRTEDAILTLERTVHPKWESASDADGAYRMFDPEGGINHIHNFLAKALGLQVAVHAG